MPLAWRLDVTYQPERGRARKMPSVAMTWSKARREARRLEALGYRVELVNLIDEQREEREARARGGSLR